MNLTHLKIQTIKRIVAHEIQAKTEKKDAVAMTRASHHPFYLILNYLRHLTFHPSELNLPKKK